MKTKKLIPQQIETLRNRIMIRLDYKTTLIINRMSSFAIWKKLYPNAEIIH